MLLMNIMLIGSIFLILDYLIFWLASLTAPTTSPTFKYV